VTTPAPLRLYLAAAPGDMDGERAVLAGLVLPELRGRLQGRGIEIVVVDPAQATGEAWDLALRFQEIAGCQIFIGLLGERYGEAPKAAPLSLVSAQPWIAEDPGRSVLELEILQGALREPGRTASFFYFRNPRFPFMIPEALQSRYLPENDEAITRLEDLEDRIRSSGRPVFDGYPCGWSEGLGRASRLDTFAEQVFEDLWDAIQEIIRPSAEATLVASAPSPREPEPPAAHVSPDKALPLHENVQFTVYRPKAVEPSKWYPLLAFAHLEELPANAAADEPDPIEEVQAQARRVLGDLAGSYADVKQDSRQAIPQEAEITFLPEIPGFEVNPPRRTFLWLESVHREEFRIRAGPESEGQRVRGRLSVFWGSILLAEVSLAIRVDAWIAGIPPSPPERAVSRPFRNIFPSYSHKDAIIVEEFERYARTLGDRYLRDVHELRAGEVWNDRLKDLIRQADVFQLFWSWNAMRSRYVEEEWRYALALSKPNFVRPTYWEDPLPEEPERRLPPDELRRLHFQLLQSGAVASSRLPKSVACSACGKLNDETARFCRGCGSLLHMPRSPGIDLNATILAFPTAPGRPNEGSSEPSLTRASPPVRSSSRRGLRTGFSIAATITLAVIGLGLFVLSRQNATRPTPIPVTVAVQSHTDPPAFPIITPEAWKRLATACRLGADSARAMPTRVPAGSPMVQVFASADGIDAIHVLSRYSSRHGFLLPQEENGHAVCTVVLGPFPSQEAASRAAAELRMSEGTDAKVVRFPEFTK
jgi:hypothetical protein